MSNILPFGGPGRVSGVATPAAFPADYPPDAAWRITRVERLLSYLSEYACCQQCVDRLVWQIIERGDGLTGLERLARRVAGETRQ